VSRGWRAALAVLAIAMASFACGRVPEPRLDAAATPMDMAIDRGSPSQPAPDSAREGPIAVEASVEAPDGPIAPDAPGDRREPDAPDPPPDVPAADGTVDSPPEMDAPWTPRALDGLVLWLDAATGITTTTGERVMRWADQSSHGNHALQNIARARPILQAGNTGQRPWVMFGMDDQLDIFLRISDTEALQWGIGDFAVLIVGRSTNTYPDYGTFIRKNMASPPFTGWLVGSGNPMSGSLFFQLRYSDVSLNTGVPPAHNTDQPFLIGVRRWDLTKAEIRLNGSSTVTATVPALNVGNEFRDIFIGAHGEEPVQQLKGGISEIVAVKGTLSPGDLAMLETYLLSKHALK
jgi:hypothetical protein